MSTDIPGTWLLLGAPAAVTALVATFGPLAPKGSASRTRIAAIALANGSLDQSLGLMSLVEGEPLTVLSTESVQKSFCDRNVLARTMTKTPGQLSWAPLALGERRALEGGLEVEAVAMPGKRAEGVAVAEDNVAFIVRGGNGETLSFAPSVAHPSEAVDALLAASQVVLFDGTFWSDDELTRVGAGSRRARDLGHWPVGGPEGSLARLQEASGRRVLIHVNNTNPILLDDTPERAAVTAAGVEVAFDGMSISI